ncbi:MAG: IpaD/SipD/SspD family type III secretion system needle tip protein [Cyclobacteriaceae bacterium]
MKSIIIVIVLGLVGHSSMAQEMSKAEKKQLVARAKQFKKNPQSLKSMLAEFERLKTVEANSKSQLNDAQSEIRSIQENLDNMASQNESLRGELQAALAKATSQPVQTGTSGFRLPQNGVVFRVQIGGYKKLDLTAYVDNTSENIQLEKNASGITEITVGQFADYYKADELKKYLRAMGVKDAWIAPYKDGSRVPLKDVLSEVKK